MAANDEECKKIIDAIVDFWYDKVLDKMSEPPYPEFGEALEQVKQEMLNA